MWEKLEQIARRCAEIGELLTVPEIYGDAKELRRLTQEQKELEPVAQCYEDYRRAERTIAEATELLSDAELRDMAQEELRQAKADKERLYEELRVLLLPRDPNDGKNVIMELRGGVGGEESALFAADLYRMYSMYAEKHGWKLELLNYNDTELGGVKEADFILNGAGAWSRLKFESGVHRVQRVPETESGGRVHTSVIVQKHYYAAFRRLTAEALALRKLRQFFLRIFSHRFYKLGSVRALLARGHAVYPRKQDVRQDKILYLVLLPELLCGLLQIVDNGYDVEIFL